MSTKDPRLSVTLPLATYLALQRISKASRRPISQVLVEALAPITPVLEELASAAERAAAGDAEAAQAIRHALIRGNQAQAILDDLPRTTPPRKRRRRPSKLKVAE